VTAAKLRTWGIRTVADVADMREAALVSLLGPAAGRHLHALAHNRDPRPVQVGKRRGSIGSQRALGLKPRSDDEVEAILAGLVDRVTRRMRAADRPGRTVVLRLRFADFTRATRSHTLARATTHTQPILRAAKTLLAQARSLIDQRGLTLVGISVANLDRGDAIQLELPLDQHSDGELDTALDAVRERFGSAAVMRGALLNKGEGLSVPMLPD
jgi:DNA polymerase-4